MVLVEKFETHIYNPKAIIQLTVSFYIYIHMYNILCSTAFIIINNNHFSLIFR